MRKQITKVLAVLLCLLMLATTVPLAFAEEPISEPASEPASEPNDLDSPTSGQCGDNVFWSYDEDTSTLTISGTGAMYYSFDSDSQPWIEYQEELQAVVIEEGVTNVAIYSFFNFRNIKNVTLANSVTHINIYAFFGCTTLETIYYGGTEQKWNSIIIENGNECLTSAEIQFAGMEDPRSGQCGDNIHWAYDENTETLTIGGEGEMWNYDYDNQPWLAYRNIIRSVFVEDGVTSIGWYAFARFSELVSVTIPNSVTCIGVDAFAVCTALSSITIPNGVTSIQFQAFVSCTRLESVMISKSVNTIDKDAFGNCTSLTGFTVDELNPAYASDNSGCLYDKAKTELFYYPIGNKRTSFSVPDSVTIISEDAFKSCDYLTEVTIPGSVKIIEAGAFSFCNRLSSVEIENGLETIGNSVFWWCENLQTVLLPDSVTSIGSNTFYACFRLNNISIPNSLETIGNSTFQYCAGLTEITIPNSITTIEEEAFNACTNLRTVTILNPDCEIFPDYGTIAENATIYGYRDSTAQAYAETYGRTFVALCPTDHANTTEVPEQPATCTENGYTAGVYCNDCKQWVEGHELIKAGHKDEDGDFICDVCGADLALSIHADETLRVDITGGAMTYLRFVPEETAPYIMTSLSDSDTYGYLFDSEMNELDANDDDTDSNFKLMNTLDAGETYYYGVRFYDEEASGSFDVFLTKESVYFGQCGDNATWKLSLPSGELRIEGAGALWEDAEDENVVPWEDHMKEIKAVKIDEGITNIPANAFFSAYQLRRIEFPQSLKSIGDYAFFCCIELRNADLPAGLETIGVCAFQGCTNLDNLWFPQSVHTIGELAFAMCGSLETVSLPEGITTVPQGLFAQCFNLREVTIPRTVTTIGKEDDEFDPFEDCFNLSVIRNLSLTATVSSTAIHKLVLPDSVSYDDFLTYFRIFAAVSLLYRSLGVMTEEEAMAYQAEKLENAFGTDYQEKVDTIIESFNDDSGTYGPKDEYPEGLIFYGFSGSAEQAYCEENNIPFVLLDRGQCGDDVYYSFDKATGTLTITGTGAMWNAEDYDGWSSYVGDVQTVVIEDGVTSIGENTFIYCTNLTDVTIPNSVETIGENAFFNCSSLTSVTIPARVSSLGEGAFRWCPALASIEVAAENPYYSSGINGCLYNKDETELIQYPIGNERTEFTVPEDVKVVGAYAFQFAEKLEKVIMPDGLKAVSDFAFYGCSAMTEINIPETVTVLGEGAFYECGSLTSIEIPSGVTTLDYNLFAFCSNLASLTIPATVTKINEAAFWNEFGIPFALTDIYYLGTEAQWNAIDINEYANDPLFAATVHFIVTDDETDVSLTYDTDVFDADVQINITEIPTGDENSRAWNITPTLNGEKVQPNGRVQVKLPIPTGWDKTKIVLTHTKANGAVEYPEFTIEGDFVVFWAEEFSTYALELQKPHVHTYDNGVVTKEATCMEEGVMTYTCTTCDIDTEGHIKTEPIGKNPANHAAYGTVVNDKLDATCTDKGYTGNNVCEGCGSTISNGSEIPALGHTSPDKHGNCERCGEHIQDVCKWCGKQHKGFFQGIIGFFHKILAAIFGAKY